MLNSAVRPIQDAGALPASGTGAVKQQSKLFPSLFKQHDFSQKVTVFETGPAMPETVKYLGQFRSMIHIANLYEEPLVREQQNEFTEEEMKQAFQDLLRFPHDTRIDICLFWDFLNYLNRPALRAFSAALRPYIHTGTRAHGFSVLNVKTPLRNQQYGIVQSDMLSTRPGRLAQLDYYPHSHEELDACLACFNIGRGWLLPDGRLEMLLNAEVWFDPISPTTQ